MPITFVVEKNLREHDKLVKIEALREAALIAKTCGNGKQMLWENWESGYRFARIDIEKLINDLIEQIALS